MRERKGIERSFGGKRGHLNLISLVERKGLPINRLLTLRQGEFLPCRLCQGSSYGGQVHVHALDCLGGSR